MLFLLTREGIFYLLIDHKALFLLNNYSLPYCSALYTNTIHGRENIFKLFSKIFVKNHEKSIFAVP